ncbi:MAG: hypothetical protein JSW28_08365 [Thermoplasmata archaeon]|nr:MAG: hypothetical protein JSW28_08365 [Thermoplasmata archaeon]
MNSEPKGWKKWTWLILGITFITIGIGRFILFIYYSYLEQLFFGIIYLIIGTLVILFREYLPLKNK